ncbi:MAG: 4Fe-4S dicluster domain-containing protein [Tepidisphaeraceae bacterium]|jgi:MauM/NapG family ferredoxin protein
MPDPLDSDKPVDRRRFFRVGLSHLLRPLTSAASPLTRAAKQLENLNKLGTSATPRAKVPSNIWLRPPGAIPEAKLQTTCTRGGDCVRVCPVQAIKIDPTANKGFGLPYIDADSAACAVCSGLKCMSVCPSGALKPTSINDIDMGTAVWWEQTCLRSSGGECKICIDHCPLGSAAIELKENRVVVNPHGCIGCGICQQDCPTTPRSITVIPIAAKSI